jgi:nucleoside-diphosphate-sugar epimerase
MSANGLGKVIPEKYNGNGALARQARTDHPFVIEQDERILVTGATGFIGLRVVENLLRRGFSNIICLTRPSSDLTQIEALSQRFSAGAQLHLLQGNLLSRSDCEIACRDVAVILHLAAGTGEKSFPDAFMNSVVATRNLLDASIQFGRLRRFVLVSSFAVYTNRGRSTILNESSPIETRPDLRDAYCYAKVKQEEIVKEYGDRFGVPYVFVRPGTVYGEGRGQITGRVGLGTFGLFLHLGGPNTVPLTYVGNCAEAIVLAGLVKGVDGEAFNVVDDNLPSSRAFLRSYKQRVRFFQSVYVPHALSFALCSLWERYSTWSKGQLPLVFSRRRWYSEWKKTGYTNQKIKELLGWSPTVPTATALSLYFDSCAQGKPHA